MPVGVLWNRQEARNLRIGKTRGSRTIRCSFRDVAVGAFTFTSRRELPRSAAFVPGGRRKL